MESINIEEIQQKLFNSLKPSGWANVLKSFLLSHDFTLILNSLLEERKKGRRFTPGIKDIFRAFTECPYSELNTIFITKEPYPELGISNGISLDCSNLKKEHIYVKSILNEIEKTIFKKNEYYDRNISFIPWCNQGILMLNVALTAVLYEKDKHIHIWDFFTTFLLDTLNTYNKGLIFVFIGEDVKKYASIINKKDHYKYTIEHPSEALKANKPWDSQNIFSIISKLVKDNYNKQIKW